MTIDDYLDNPTRGYQRSWWAQWNTLWYGSYSGTVFNYQDVPYMRTYPTIQFGLEYSTSPYTNIKLCGGKNPDGAYKPLNVGNRPDATAFVERCFKKFWMMFPKLMKQKACWGRWAAGVEFKWNRRDRIMEIQRIRDIEPNDTDPRIFANGRRRGDFAGFEVRSSTSTARRVTLRHALYYAGDEEEMPFVDTPLLKGAHTPWMEANVRGGARASRRLAIWRRAIGSTIIRFPQGVKVPNPSNPNEMIDAQDAARIIGELMMNGSLIMLNNKTDQNGKYIWDIEERDAPGNGSEIQHSNETISLLNDEMYLGMKIPQEIFDSKGTGSYSGKSIPMESWYTRHDSQASRCWNMFRENHVDRLVLDNYDIREYDAELTSLLADFRQQSGAGPGKMGDAAGGGGPGGDQGQPSPGAPYFGPRGGRGTLGPDGKPIYNHGGDRDRADLSDLWEEANRTSEHILHKAIAHAMLTAKIRELKGDYDEDTAGDIIHWLPHFAHDHEEAQAALKLKPVNLSAYGDWEQRGTTASGKTRWYSKAAGQYRYQKSRPGTWSERKNTLHGIGQKGLEILERVAHNRHTPEELHQLAAHIHAMTVPQLRRARASLRATFMNGKQRDHMTAALTRHVQHLINHVGDPDAPPPPRRPVTGAAAKTAKRANGTPANPVNHDVYTVDPKSLKVDAQRFQYKVVGIGSGGVSDELKGTDKWNPELGGTLLVWRDPKDGQDYVINGHHRHELASRVGTDKVNVRYINAHDAVEARARGALANIAEGRGTATDAAKYLRDSGQDIEHLKRAGVSMSGRVAADAEQLKDLSSKAFQRLTTGDLDEKTAVDVAKHLKDHTLQDTLFKIIDKKAEEGKPWSSHVVETAAKKMAKAGKTTVHNDGGLFGDWEDEQSTFAEESELESHVKRGLQKRANDFAAVSNSGRAERVKDAGNTLAVEENQKRAKTANDHIIDFDRESGLKSPISEVVKEEAANLKRATTPKVQDEIRKRTAERIQKLLDAGATAFGRDAEPVATQPGASGAGGASNPGTIGTASTGPAQTGGGRIEPFRDFAKRFKHPADAAAEYYRQHGVRVSGADYGFKDSDLDAALSGQLRDESGKHWTPGAAGGYHAFHEANKTHATPEDSARAYNEFKAAGKLGTPGPAAEPEPTSPKPSTGRKQIGTDLLGNPIYQAPAASNAVQPTLTEDIAPGLWMEHARAHAADNGLTIDQFHAGGRFRSGEQWYQVGKAEDGYPVFKSDADGNPQAEPTPDHHAIRNAEPSTPAALPSSYNLDAAKARDAAREPLPPLAAAAGVKSWADAHKKGLTTYLTDAPEAVARALKPIIGKHGLRPSAIDAVAAELAQRVGTQGGHEVALRGLINDYDRRDNGEPGDGDRNKAIAEALRTLNPKTISPSSGPSTPSTPAAPELKPGDKFTIPENNTTGTFDAILRDAGDNYTWEGADGKTRLSAKIPKSQFPRFLDDLNGVVRAGPSGNANIDAVTSGKAKFLARGNDGLAFDAGDKVVKVSSDLPFHWNTGIRPEGEGARRLAEATDKVELLRKSGIDGILPQEAIQHDGRTFVVMPKLDTKTPLTQEQFDQVKETVRKLHDAGYSPGDDIQAGIGADGRAYLYDLANAKKISKDHTGGDDTDTDNNRMERLAKQHGVEFDGVDPGRELDKWQDSAIKHIDLLTRAKAKNGTLKPLEAAHASRSIVEKLEQLAKAAPEAAELWDTARTIQDIKDLHAQPSSGPSTPASIENAKTGQPIKMTGFHGTTGTFDKIDPAQGSMKAAFFSDHPDVAASFGIGAAKVMGGTPRLLAADVHAKNPLVIDANGRPAADWQFGGNNRQKLLDEVKRGGHDAVVLRNTSDGSNSAGMTLPETSNVVMVFDHNAIQNQRSHDHPALIGSMPSTPSTGTAAAPEPTQWHKNQMTGGQFASFQKMLGIKKPTMGETGTAAINAALAARPGGKIIENIMKLGNDYGWNREDGTPNAPGDAIRRVIDGKHTPEELLDAAKWASGSNVRDGADRFLFGSIKTANTIDGKPVDPVAFAHVQEAAKLRGLIPKQSKELQAATANKAAEHERHAAGLIGSGPSTPSKADADAAAAGLPSSIDGQAVKYVRAKAGGEISPITGRHYKGGQLMPIHGAFAGLGKPAAEPTGASSAATPAVDKGQEPEAPRRGPAAPMDPDAAAAKREELERKRRYEALKAGPLGGVKFFPDSGFPKDERTDFAKWRTYTDQLGADGVARLKSALQDKVHGHIDEQARAAGLPPDDSGIQWEKAEAARQAQTDREMFPRAIGKMHDGAVESRWLLQHALRQRWDGAQTPLDQYEHVSNLLKNVGAGAGGAPAGSKPPSSGPSTPSTKPEEPPPAHNEVLPVENSPPPKPTPEAQPKPEPEPPPDPTPREAAKAEDLVNEQLDAKYKFARASAVSNLGEDLTGSARHKRNEWKGLRDAENNGTAEELVKRDNLLQAEPHKLGATIEPATALTHLASHLAMNAFPAQLDADQVKAYTHPVRSGKPDMNPDKLDAAALRAQYYEAYQTLKSEAERLAVEHTDPQKVLTGLEAKTKELIHKYRQTETGTHGGYPRSKDPTNPTANALVDTYQRLGWTNWRPKATSVQARVLDFGKRLATKYGTTPTPEHLEAAKSHVLDIMDGQSFNKTFGTTEAGRKPFSAADRYVKHATRKGGRAIDTTTIEAGSRHMMDNVKLRGLQWGNSVSDEERQHHLQQSAGALADLADMIGFDDHHIGLGGKLGLAIGARGRGSALAHYEPDTKVINLTRTGGVGSLAHEWGHALDHAITGHRGFATDLPDRAGPEFREAYDGFRKALYDSGFNDRLRNHLDTLGMTSKEKAYWSSRAEVFARTFERHVQRKLHKEGRENTYLTGLRKEGDPLWPTDAELDAVAPAMEKLMALAKRNITQGG